MLNGKQIVCFVDFINENQIKLDLFGVLCDNICTAHYNTSNIIVPSDPFNVRTTLIIS